MTCVICLLQWMGVGLGIVNDLCYMPSAVDGGWAARLGIGNDLCYMPSAVDGGCAGHWE